jgi:hypothetical protein
MLCLMVALTGSFDAAPGEVFETAHAVLTAQHYTVEAIIPEELITDYKEIDLTMMTPYISEIFPDDNPGWEKARARIMITVSGDEKSDIQINAFFERFGVPDALLLIPPTWVSVPSNVILESEILLRIEDTLQGEQQ